MNHVFQGTLLNRENNKMYIKSTPNANKTPTPVRRPSFSRDVKSQFSDSANTTMNITMGSRKAKITLPTTDGPCTLPACS